MMTPNETINWLKAIDKKEKKSFIESLLADITIMNRAICSDTEMNNETKIECLKWSNELAHRLLNFVHELKKVRIDDFENRLVETIVFNGNQVNELKGHIGSTVLSVVDRFKNDLYRDK